MVPNVHVRGYSSRRIPMARVQAPALVSSARWFDLEGVCGVLVMASPQVKANLSSEDVDVTALIEGIGNLANRL